MAIKVIYGKWIITYDPKPIPIRSLDYDFVHEDYDGGPEYSYDLPADNRCGNGKSVEDCSEQINDIEINKE